MHALSEKLAEHVGSYQHCAVFPLWTSSGVHGQGVQCTLVPAVQQAAFVYVILLSDPSFA